MHEPDGDIRSHPLTMTKLHHEHREGFNIRGILQGTCVHWLETGITDQFGNFVFRAGIVARSRYNTVHGMAPVPLPLPFSATC
jgi:hypothetical protein